MGESTISKKVGGLKLLYASAQKGNGEAMYTIGLLYERGQVVERDRNKAIVADPGAARLA